jgi:hypothetical protein
MRDAAIVLEAEDRVDGEDIVAVAAVDGRLVKVKTLPSASPRMSRRSTLE